MSECYANVFGTATERPYSYISLVLNDAMSYFDIFFNTIIPELEDQNVHLVCLDSSTALINCFCTVYYSFFL